MACEYINFVDIMNTYAAAHTEREMILKEKLDGINSQRREDDDDDGGNGENDI
jgi:hypothetical protein